LHGRWRNLERAYHSLTNTTIASLAIDPARPATLYAGTYGGGIFKTKEQVSSIYLPVILRNP